MDRRDFMKSAGVGITLAALPESLLASVSGLSDDDIEKKVAELISQMSLDEKIKQMAGTVPISNIIKRLSDKDYPDSWNTPENKRLKIPSLKCVDGPRGAGTQNPTCFPVSMCRGATWDAELEERVGDVIGYEGRALGVNVLLTPCINLLWHPSWGRAQETYGEDQHHLGMMGAAHTIGLQNHVMACPKHFAVNNIEESRFFLDARMDERTLREVYLPHFKKCVDAGAASVMSAYNDLNGELCGHNKHLLRDILKEEWGFDGFVVSDWFMAVEDEVEAAEGGLDLEMPFPLHFGKKLKKAVKKGLVSEDIIDEAATRIIRQKLRFITDNMQDGYDRGKVAGKEFVQVALETARKGIVLLKNENNVLPLKQDKDLKIAIIGELADTENLGDKGSSAVNPPYTVTPLQGMINKIKSGSVVQYEKGKNIEKAKALAQGSDVAVVVVGLTWKDEGEYIPQTNLGGDRDDLGLHEKDIALIKAAAGVNKNTVVVLEAGSAITMEGWHDKVPAIIMAWYPGMEGGNALAEIIFGEVNPSGKLPISFPKSMGQLYKFDKKAEVVEYDYYHGYNYFDKENKEPLYPFGFGMSYTEYKYSNLRLDKKSIGKTGSVKAMVDVTNAGDMAGEEVVQLYVGYAVSAVHRPVKSLKAFTRVSIKPGETKTAELSVNAEDLAYYDEQQNKWVVEDIEYAVYVGPSSKQEDLLTTSFKIP
jgi:beta-glucosidase